MGHYGKTFGLTPDGDLVFSEQNRFEWVEGKQAVSQDIRVTITTIEGEDPIDTDHGLDVFTVTGGSEANLRRELRETILEDDRVSTVDSISLEETGSRAYEAVINVTLTEDETVSFTV